MGKSIIVIALEKELQHQEKLLRTVTEMIEYDPFGLMLTAMKDFNDCKGDIKRKLQIADQIEKYRKEGRKRTADKIGDLIKKQVDYEFNIQRLKNKLFYETHRGDYETI